MTGLVEWISFPSRARSTEHEGSPGLTPGTLQVAFVVVIFFLELLTVMILEIVIFIPNKAW